MKIRKVISREELERRFVIAMNKVTLVQCDIFQSVRFDDVSYEELAERHGLTVEEVINAFARALLIWSRCLNARFPHLVWPWW